MIQFASEETYQLAGCLVDGFAAILFLIILLTVHRVPTASVKLKRAFVLSNGLGLMTAVADFCAILLWHNDTLFKIYRITSSADCILLVLSSAINTYFVLMYLDNGNKINRVIKYISAILFDILILFHLVPPLFRLLYCYEPGRSDILMGKGYVFYILGYLVVTVLVTVAIVINRSTLGLRDTFWLVMLKSATIFFYYFVWNEVPPTLLLMAIFMMFIYISIYQGRIWQASQQEKELTEKKLELKDMRTRVMLSQIQPHFLYNTLTTIAYLCHKDPETAEMLTNRFSEYLRTNISFLSNREKISFEEELANLQNYLEIEKVRFKNRLQVVYDIQVSDFSVPMLSLQPMAENAVKHGICKREDGGTLWISTFMQGQNICIEIKDDGVGFDKAAVAKDGKLHVGLNNVQKRVEMAGGKMYVESLPGVGTTVRMVFAGR